MFTEQQKKKILGIAREALNFHLTGKTLLPLSVEDAELNEKRGVFVTIKKQGELRGCIGYIYPKEPLVEAVRKTAIQSALEDPRFSPLTCEELDDIKLEVSVLTVPKKVDSVDEIVMGRDGVIIKKGERQGVFLPQVAEETGWNKEDFLNNLCLYKVGLPEDSWKEKDVEIHTFQAEVFSE